MAWADDLADAEFRVVEAAFNRHVENDFAVAVLQDGDGQPHRQVRGVRAVHLVAESELVEGDDIFRGQLFPTRLYSRSRFSLPSAMR